MIELQHYISASGVDVFDSWLTSLKDQRAAAQVVARIDRLCVGNFGDCKPVGQGVWELRIDCGPGYRVYYAMIGRTRLLLLCGGDKRRQSADIARAVAYFKDYQRRRAKP